MPGPRPQRLASKCVPVGVDLAQALRLPGARPDDAWGRKASVSEARCSSREGDSRMALVAQRGISIILPAYNEEDNIAKAVEQAVHCVKALFQDWEVIVVNDGSQDKTGEIIDGLSEQNERVIALHHSSNQGYGAALKTGILQACQELIFFCDSDLQFHLSELVLPLTWIEQYDIVIGYRAKRQDPWHRRLNALGWKALVRLLLGLRARDIDCAFK